jgi:hypothetical protein
MLLSEQRRQLDSVVKESLIANGRSPKKILTHAEMKNSERENLIAALQATNYRIGAGGAAELLGVKPTTLASRIKALQIPLRRVPLVSVFPLSSGLRARRTRLSATHEVQLAYDIADLRFHVFSLTNKVARKCMSRGMRHYARTYVRVSLTI